MGNRGLLHDETGQIVRSHRGRRWLICLPAFRGRRRQIMAPGRYTELFFLDEPTALAAGHRPCAECRRADFLRFADLWAEFIDGSPQADAIDYQLHRERHAPTRPDVTDPTALPNGAFVQNSRGEALLIWHAQSWLWSPFGYTHCPAGFQAEPLVLLTPSSTVRVLMAGYRPMAHPTVR